MAKIVSIAQRLWDAYSVDCRVLADRIEQEERSGKRDAAMSARHMRETCEMLARGKKLWKAVKAERGG